jgi:AcrR family transcriptional regulator
VRNDERVLRAARDALTQAPDASMAQIAARAGVGVGTLYRRYPNRDALLAQVCLDGVRGVQAAADLALDRARSHPWGAFVGFVTACMVDGDGSLVAAVAGTFRPTAELVEAAERLRSAVQELLESVQAAQAVRTDITAADVAMILRQLRAVGGRDLQRSAALRRRYLGLILQAFRPAGAAPLPGSSPDWDEIRDSWEHRRGGRSLDA